jgi:hypothetical protein
MRLPPVIWRIGKLWLPLICIRSPALDTEPRRPQPFGGHEDQPAADGNGRRLHGKRPPETTNVPILKFAYVRYHDPSSLSDLDAAGR